MLMISKFIHSQNPSLATLIIISNYLLSVFTAISLAPKVNQSYD